MSSARLGIGFVGSGFITRFHIESLVGVRDADVRGVWSPNREHAEEAAALARSLGVGDAKAHTSIADMVADRRAPTPSAAAELAVPDRL